MASFPSYSLAKSHADGLVKDLAKGSQVTALHPAQARDTLAALERLENFRQSTGRRYSILAAVSEFVETLEKLQGRSLGEAVEEFLDGRKHKAEAKDGKRAQLSASYEIHVASWLRGFAKTFPATAVCELTKDHLNLHFKAFTEGPDAAASPLPVSMPRLPSVERNALPHPPAIFQNAPVEPSNLGSDQSRSDLSMAAGITDEENEWGIRINNRKVVRYLSGKNCVFWSFYKPANLTNPLKKLKFKSGAPIRS